MTMAILGISEKNQFKAFQKLSTIAVTVATRSLLKKGWKSITKNDPPDDPSKPSVLWKEALLWGAATGLSLGITRVATRRLADQSWKKFKGPKPLLA